MERHPTSPQAAEVPPNVAELAAEWKLGALLSVQKAISSLAQVAFGLITFAVALGLAYLMVVAAYNDIVSPSPLTSAIMLPLIFMIVYGPIHAVRALFLRNKRWYLYTDGVVRSHGRRLWAFRWSDVDKMTRKRGVRVGSFVVTEAAYVFAFANSLPRLVPAEDGSTFRQQLEEAAEKAGLTTGR